MTEKLRTFLYSQLKIIDGFLNDFHYLYIREEFPEDKKYIAKCHLHDGDWV